MKRAFAVALGLLALSATASLSLGPGQSNPDHARTECTYTAHGDVGACS